MINKCLVLLTTIMTFSIISSAQWQNLTSGLDFEGKVLLYDSVDGKLYVGGNFCTLVAC